MTFEVSWEAEDGYVGGARPQHFRITPADLPEMANDVELRAFLWEEVERDFSNKITWFIKNEADFLQWARQFVTDPS